MTEDSQPNEVFRTSHAVPVVRASRGPNWCGGYEQMSNPGASQHSRRQRSWQPASGPDSRNGPYHRRDFNPIHPKHTVIPSPSQTSHASPNFGIRRGGSMNSAPPSPTLVTSPPRKRVILPYSGRYPAASRPNLSSSCIGGSAQQRPRDYNAIGDRTPRKRMKVSALRVNETKVDLPPDCRRNAFRRAHFKAVFLAEFCDRLKQSANADILGHHFTDTQLVVTYRTPEFYYASRSRGVLATGSLNSLDRSLCGSSFPAMDLIISPTESSEANPSCDISTNPLLTIGRSREQSRFGTSIPCGSNEKLEDLCRGEYVLPPPTKDISSSLESTKTHGSEFCSSIVKEKQGPTSALAPISAPPRLFRSGCITLTYGPPGCRDEDIPCPVNRRPVASDVVEIDLSSPPEQNGFERNTEFAAVGNAKLPNCPTVQTHHMEDVKPGLIWAQDVFLGEGASIAIQLPRTNGDKMRRIISSDSMDSGYCVTMRGFVYEADLNARKHIRELHWHDRADKDYVEDVCCFPPPFDKVMIVAQPYEDNSLSLLHLEDNPKRRVTPISRQFVDHERLRRGVSAVTTLPTSASSLSFVSAGYDHVIHLWSFDTSAAFSQPPIAGALDIHHSSLVQSMLSVGNRLLSGGADNSIRIWDLQAAQVISTIRTSNSVYQLHQTDNPDVVLAEVAHRDLQFEMHDFRLLTDGRPPLRFGYSSAQGVHGRYIRGVVDPYKWATFASGGRDGIVRLWDLRNAKQCKQGIMCCPGQKVVHAAFTEDSLVVASDDNRLLFFDFAQS